MMSIFLKLVLRYVAIFFILIWGFFTSLMLFVPEKIDEFYIKVSKPKSASLIIGTSRASLGISPSTLNKRIPNEPEFFNFAFSLGDSPYGEMYNRAIEKKLLNGKGTIIIAVDPWALSVSDANRDDNPELYREQNSKICDLYSYTVQPNYQYTVFRLNNKYWNLLWNVLGSKPTKITQPDGQELKLTNDTLGYQQRALKLYNIYLTKKDTLMSPGRLASLEKLIANLKLQQKEIYLVRLPMATMFFNYEDSIFPQFNRQMLQLSRKTKVPYFNMTNTNEQFITVDGHHLRPIESISFTKMLADSIQSYRTVK